MQRLNRRTWTIIAGALIVAVLSGVMAKMPVPYVLLAPGRALDTLGTLNGEPMISITGAQSEKTEGNLRFTTVAVYDGVSLVDSIRAWFDDEIAVVPRETIYPPGEDEKKAEEESVQQFTTSQTTAVAVALKQLGYPLDIVVAAVPRGSPATDILQEGDKLIAVNGEKATSMKEFIAFVKALPPDSDADITVQRQGEEQTLSIPLEPRKDDPEEAQLGISVSEEYGSDVDVNFDVNGVGGPSAGLMFTLGILDKLDPTELTGGRNIAGTGTIDRDGVVGPIGGIAQKLVAAKAQGATAFLVPEENCRDAKRNRPDGLQLAKVASLDDALTALESVRKDTNPIPC